MGRPGVSLVTLLMAVVAPPLWAQAWNAPDARDLIDRGIERRSASFADSSLRDWTARAHGFVFFLGQVGEDLAEPPRLVKADQLELEVYWRLPNLSKQRIIGWRDRTDLPTDINYHRDHLGIVMNNFPDLIRLGEGDEVRDVPHPVSAAGRGLYEYALGDTVTLTLPGGRELRVAEVKFRPLEFRAPRIVGSAFLELGTADLVRMAFSFSRAAYLDRQLEDITVSVENSLWEGRWWLPLRQEIEIRRRATFMDFPARGIIRGRFEIDGYRFNTGLDPVLFRAGPPIVAAPRSVRDTFPWPESLDVEIRDVARPATLEDFDAVRAQAVEIAAGHVLTGLKQRQFAARSISDFLHVNRVEGLTPGAGAALRSADETRELRLRAGFGTASDLLTGAAAFTTRHGRTTWRIAAAREVRETGDIPVISRVVNSITSQEGGRDFGDYYLASGGSLGFTRLLGGRGALRLEGAFEHVDSLVAVATSARGPYRRENPGTEERDWALLRAQVTRRTPSFAVSRDLTGSLEVEGGFAEGQQYARLFAEARLQLPAGGATVLLRAAGGAATASVPRHRTFVLGGRGTLLGEPFRGLGGRTMAWLSTEWQLPVRIPEIRMGSFAGTGRRLTVAPSVAAGWMGGRVAGVPGTPAAGPDVALGLGASWLHDLFRFDVGYGLSSGQWGFSLDVSRSFWDIL